MLLAYLVVDFLEENYRVLSVSLELSVGKLQCRHMLML